MQYHEPFWPIACTAAAFVAVLLVLAFAPWAWVR